jgi:lycopene cyclase domain-containing protein
MEYLFILIVLLLSALLAEYLFGIHLYESREERIVVTLFFFVIGVLWDTFAIMQGHWSFNETGLVGIRLGIMPIEEYLFILIIPFWIITMYKLFEQRLF